MLSYIDVYRVRDTMSLSYRKYCCAFASIILSSILLTVGVSVLLLPSIPDASAAEPSANNNIDVSSDFNGDGIQDLAIGVPLEDIGGIFNAGAVHVLYGSLAGLQTSSPVDQFWRQDSPGVDNFSEPGDEFGHSLASGDFNNDGYGDLAIGVREDLGVFDSAGAVNVLYGSSIGLRTSPAPDGTGRTDQFWHQGKPDVEDTQENEDYFGFSFS